jgi:hypothetical protein
MKIEDVIKSDLSIEDLEKAIEEKKEIEFKESMPKPLSNPDYKILKQTAITIIEKMADEDYCDDNSNKQWIYEAAMEAVFGPSVWQWIINRE